MCRGINIIDERSRFGQRGSRQEPDALCWIVLGEDGTFTVRHVDANGECTDAFTAEGVQLWLYPKNKVASHMLSTFGSEKSKDRFTVDDWGDWVYWIFIGGQLLCVMSSLGGQG